MIPLGLEVVYPPPGEAPPASYARQVDIICVHSLGRDSIKTWHHDSSGKTWISDPEFLGSLKRSVRVLTYTYNSDIAANMNSASIGLHASELLELIRVCYDRSGGGPTIFVAHGFGGTIMKKFVEVYSSRPFRMAEDTTNGIIFLGTPHSTTDADVILQSVKAVAALHSNGASSVSRSDMRDYAASVRHTNAELRTRMMQKLDIADVYETLPTLLYDEHDDSHHPIEVVPRGGSRLRTGNPLQIKLECTHMGLASFASPTDPAFLELHRLLVIMTNRAKQNGQGILPLGPSFPPMMSSMPPMPMPAPIPSPMPMPGPPPFPSPSPSPSPPPPYGPKVDIIDRRGIRPPPGSRPPPPMPNSRFHDWLKKQDKEAEVKVRNTLLGSLRGWTEANGGNEILPLPGTCSWIRSNPHFKAWLESPHSTALLCSGSSGCGKTHWAKFIANHLTATRPMDVVVPFFHVDDEVERSRPPLFEYMIHHILRRRPDRFREIPSLYWDRQPDSPPFSLESLADILLHIKRSKSTETVFFVIDGLGDCDLEFARKILRHVAVLVHQSSPETGAPSSMHHQDGPTWLKFKFLFTSQVNEVISAAPCFTGLKGALIARDEDIRRDISIFVDAHLDMLADDVDRTLLNQHKERIKDHSDMFFTFASMACADFLTATAGDRLGFGHSGLDCPDRLRRHYDRRFLPLIQSIDNQKYSVEVLCIAAGGYPETFSLGQISDALHGIHSEADLEGLRLRPLLLQQCPRFLDLYRDSVRLIHPSFLDYLTDTLSPAALGLFMAEVCVTYLSRPCFHAVPWQDHPITDPRSAKNIMEDSHPFYHYAATTWRLHLLRAGTAGTMSAALLQKLDGFLVEGSAGYKTWHQYMTWVLGGQKEVDLCVPQPFFALISTDQVDLIQRYLPDNLGRRWSVPLPTRILSWVPSLGSTAHEEALRGVSGQLGRSPLHVCVRTVAKSALALFINLGVNIDQRAPELGDTPLYLACRQYTDACVYGRLNSELKDDAQDFLDLATILLEAGADPNIPAQDGISCLHEACRTGRLELVDLLLQHGAEVNVSSLRGETVLEAAVFGDQLDVIERLVSAGVDVDTSFSNSRSPISNALQQRNVACFRIFACHTDDVNQRDHSGLGPIHHIVMTGHSHLLPEILDLPGVQLDLLSKPPGLFISESALNMAITKRDYTAAELLLAAGATPGYIPEMGSKMPLLRAVDLDLPSFVILLIQHGARINDLERRPNLRARTALAHAVSEQRGEIVRILLDHGADPTVEEAYGLQSVLAKAILKRDLSLARLLLQHWIPPTVDYKTTQQGHAFFSIKKQEDALEFVELLLDHGASPHAMYEDSEAMSPMHYAAFNGWLDVCKLFFKLDPDFLDLQYEQGLMSYTPLHWAASGGHLETVRYLLEAGARADALSFWCNDTAFSRACRVSHVEVAKALHEVSPQLLDHSTYNGTTPLLEAFQKGNIPVIKYLLGQGANPRLLNLEGSSCVRLALESDDSSIMPLILLLVRHGIEPNETIGDGRFTVLGEACRMGVVPAVKYLLDIGGDPLQCQFSRDGSKVLTALRVAVHFREPAVVEFLLERPDVRGHIADEDWLNQSLLSMDRSRPRVRETFSKVFWASEEIRMETGRDQFAEMMVRRDDFGLTPIDLARDGVHRSPPQHAVPRIRQHIREHASALAGAKRFPKDLVALEDLAEFLAMLGGSHDEAAVAITKRTAIFDKIRIKDGHNEKGVACFLMCDRCDDYMDDAMHICRFCSHTLCPRCWEKWGETKADSVHDVLKIPFDESADLNTPAVQQLLDAIASEFTDDGVDNAAAAITEGGTSGTIEDPDSDATTLSLATLHAFGLLEFQRRAWSPSIGLARAVYQRLGPWHEMISLQRAVVQRRILEAEVNPERMKSELDYFLGSGLRAAYRDEGDIRYGWTLEALAPMFEKGEDDRPIRMDRVEWEIYERAVSESNRSAYTHSTYSSSIC